MNKVGTTPAHLLPVVLVLVLSLPCLLCEDRAPCTSSLSCHAGLVCIDSLCSPCGSLHSPPCEGVNRVCRVDPTGDLKDVKTCAHHSLSNFNAYDAILFIVLFLTSML